MTFLLEDKHIEELPYTVQEIKKAIEFYHKERERNRESCKKRYVPTGRPRGRPAKTSPAGQNYGTDKSDTC